MQKLTNGGTPNLKVIGWMIKNDSPSSKSGLTNIWSSLVTNWKAGGADMVVNEPNKMVDRGVVDVRNMTDSEFSKFMQDHPKAVPYNGVIKKNVVVDQVVMDRQNSFPASSQGHLISQDGQAIVYQRSYAISIRRPEPAVAIKKLGSPSDASPAP
jgi:hypothetical protein